MVVNGSFGRILVLNVRRQFRNDRFVFCLLESRLGDGQHIPFVFNDILVYFERLISDFYENQTNSQHYFYVSKVLAIKIRFKYNFRKSL